MSGPSSETCGAGTVSSEARAVASPPRFVAVSVQTASLPIRIRTLPSPGEASPRCTGAPLASVMRISSAPVVRQASVISLPVGAAGGSTVKDSMTGTSGSGCTRTVASARIVLPAAFTASST